MPVLLDPLEAFLKDLVPELSGHVRDELFFRLLLRFLSWQLLNGRGRVTNWANVLINHRVLLTWLTSRALRDTLVFLDSV